MTCFVYSFTFVCLLWFSCELFAGLRVRPVMADKSSSSRTQPSTESLSGGGRFPPYSSRQSKEKAAEVSHRTPTPHPAKRSSTQLCGPRPPPKRRRRRSPVLVLRWVRLTSLFQTQSWGMRMSFGPLSVLPVPRLSRRGGLRRFHFVFLWCAGGGACFTAYRRSVKFRFALANVAWR